MANIIKEQKIERDEDYGGGKITQTCNYNSTSEIIKIETDNQTLILPVSEFRLLFDLINNTLATKGHSL